LAYQPISLRVTPPKSRDTSLRATSPHQPCGDC
jgi:hypothetical protein